MPARPVPRRRMHVKTADMSPRATMRRTMTPSVPRLCIVVILRLFCCTLALLAEEDGRARLSSADTRPAVPYAMTEVSAFGVPPRSRGLANASRASARSPDPFPRVQTGQSLDALSASQGVAASAKSVVVANSSTPTELAETSAKQSLGAIPAAFVIAAAAAGTAPIKFGAWQRRRNEMQKDLTANNSGFGGVLEGKPAKDEQEVPPKRPSDKKAAQTSQSWPSRLRSGFEDLQGYFGELLAALVEPTSVYVAEPRPVDRDRDNAFGKDPAAETRKAALRSGMWIRNKFFDRVMVVSTINHGDVRWTPVARQLSFGWLILLTIVAYPVIAVAAILGVAFVIGANMNLARPKCGGSGGASGGDDAVADDAAANIDANDDGNGVGPGIGGCQAATQDGLSKDPLFVPTILQVQDLTPASQRAYAYWARFCRWLPCLMVFATPPILAGFAFAVPPEALTVISLQISGCVVVSSVHMAVFAVIAVLGLLRSMSDADAEGSENATSDDLSADSVTHWVIVPQFEEDVDIVSATLDSIRRNKEAKALISICLAMELREKNVQQKADELTRRFEGEFAEIFVSLHPVGLPNHPPGKASNTSWAYSVLVQHLRKTSSNLSRVLLTVSDADSVFHEAYFNRLSTMYMSCDPEKRDVLIWQSPIFHAMNYHRQPMAIAVGTVFTCLQDMAALADPHAVRLPYSTYSLSLSLARRVGGWDPEWIGEDWHMGMKCYLLTGGKSCVVPLMLPTMNYTPEETSWLLTVKARWTQAKRHALGFSDIVYYISSLPLVFGYFPTEKEKVPEGRIAATLGWISLCFTRVTFVIRLINAHVMLGIVTAYGILGFLLKALLFYQFSGSEAFIVLSAQFSFNMYAVTMMSQCCLGVNAISFVVMYESIKKRVEGEPYRYRLGHVVLVVLSFLVWSPCYFMMLGIAASRAAICILTQDTFVYEVAPKPASAYKHHSYLSSGESTDTVANANPGSAVSSLA
eukprot:TRINITY_DN34513_c0_g1_i1.p1 TRINITY_DN34513_c0_g1~~TRINITY_DN34513_c0_g1_i1.p1  ORF type:complete len:978 (-),score=164.39 TRINITY_DN34513_c0_g1_i1:88-3021(-)